MDQDKAVRHWHTLWRRAVSDSLKTVHRIVGPDPTGTMRAELERFFARQFARAYSDDVTGVERRKSRAEVAIIRRAARIANMIRAQYGVPPLPMQCKHVHVMPTEHWWGHDTETGGIYRVDLQGAAIQEFDRLAPFAHKALHELVHMASYQAVRIDGDRFRDYRIGLLAVTSLDGKACFTMLNEAVTEQLVIDHFPMLFSLPCFAEDRRTTEPYRRAMLSQLEEEHIEHLGVREMYSIVERGHEVHMEAFTYKAERAALWDLIRAIRSRSRTPFADDREVFQLFALGLMRGNILPLGRLVDQTFGKGTFRALAFASTTAETLSAFTQILVS